MFRFKCQTVHPTLTGAGFVFKFAVEHPDVLNDGTNPNWKAS